MGRIISIFDNWDTAQKANLAVNIALAFAEQTREQIALFS